MLKHYLVLSNNNSKNLLFINTGQIGDLIISSLIFKNADILKKKYDNIYFLLKYEFAELFKDENKINFIQWNYKKYKYNIIYRIKFLLNLRKLNIIDTFNLTAARGITVDELSLLSGGKNIFALNSNYRYLTKLFGESIDKMYTKILAKNILNEYDKNIIALKYLGLDYQFDKTNYQRKDNNTYKYDIVIAPFSSLRNKEWGRKKFEKLIKILSQKNKILLLGAFEQKNKLDSLKKDNDNVSIDAGEIPLNNIQNVIKNSKLFIGLDSGLSHIALKVGTPLIAIIGGALFGRFFPYNDNYNTRYLYNKMDCFGCELRCIHKEPYCLTEVTVDEVLKNAYEILDNYEDS